MRKKRNNKKTILKKRNSRPFFVAIKIDTVLDDSDFHERFLPRFFFSLFPELITGLFSGSNKLASNKYKSSKKGHEYEANS